MEILLLFAFVSGLVTIFAPCIWPLLPIILSASTSGGHKKPLGITLGIIISFAVITLTISYIVKLIPFDPELLRYFAVTVIGFLGLTLLIPALSQRLEAGVSRLSGKLGIVSDPQKTGFWAGFITGFALGIVWTPCAGPILATIATLAATQAVTFNVILVTVVYVIGVGIPLFIFATVGNRVFSKSRFLSKYTGQVQQVFGVIMILTAVSIATGFDKTLQVKLLDAVPSYGNFINQLESNDAVKNELDKLRQRDTNENTQMAPEFVGITKWLNTEKPLTMKELRGKVVLIDIWTYTCINCLRTIPRVNTLFSKYSDQGLVVVGVHSPEFEFEKDVDNVQSAIKRFNIKYPVALDNDFATWNAYNNQYWPAKYLIDAKGVVRYSHFGEGNYAETEQMIQLLLKEAGKDVNTTIANDRDSIAYNQLSPETYLGSERMAYLFPQGRAERGEQDFNLIRTIPANRFSLGGQWRISDEYAEPSANARLLYNFNAEKVFMVLKKATSSNGQIKIMLDGKPVTTDTAGADVRNGVVTVTEDRLYEIIDLKGRSQNHLLELQFLTPGIQAFTFTFG